jgi:hypothetical protein
MSLTSAMSAQGMREPKDFKEFLGSIDNLYGRKSLSPPFLLSEYAERWLAEGIHPLHCIEQTRLYLGTVRSIPSGSGERTLPVLDEIIRRTWLELQYPPADSPNADERSEGESRDSPVIEENYNQIRPSWVPEPLRHEPMQSALDYAVAFLRRELADGRKILVNELNKRARAAKIAPRTLERARKKLKVQSHRTGFGRTAQHWVSLPKP